MPVGSLSSHGFTSDTRLTDAGSHLDDTLGTPLDLGLLEPRGPVFVGPMEAVAGDVLESRDLGQGALQLLEREVEGVVLDGLALGLEGLEENADLAKIAMFRDQRVRG